MPPAHNTVEMPAIDFPLQSGDLPRLGSFVAIALDPVASLDALGDETVYSAATTVETRRRIVMVDSSLMCEPGVSYFRYHPVGSGLPFTTWQSVPIEPATVHPEGRPPIAVSHPLPVRDPYVYTTEAFEGAVSRVYLNKLSEIKCTDSDRRRVARQHLDDNSRVYAEEHNPSVDAEIDPISAGWQDDSAWNQLDGGFIAWEGCVHTLVRPMYHMWLHIEEGDSYADPSSLQDELDQLYAIETEWQERQFAQMEAKDDQLREWRDAIGIPDGPHEHEVQGQDGPSHEYASMSPEGAAADERTCGGETLTDDPADDKSMLRDMQGPSANWNPSDIAESDFRDATGCNEHHTPQAQPACSVEPQTLDMTASASSSSEPGSTHLSLGSAGIADVRKTAVWRWLGEGARLMFKIPGILSVFIPGRSY